MIDHQDWFQWKSILPEVKRAKKTIQQVLKPGGGGVNSTNIGKYRFLQFYEIACPRLSNDL